jgi:hypothetical protein
MSHRIEKLNQRRAATRHLLGWFGVTVARIALAGFSVTCSAQQGGVDTGLMLRPGLEMEVAVDPASLPADGWYRVTQKDGALQVLAVGTPAPASGEAEAEEIDTRYIRVPGARIAEGRLPTVAFSRGVLTPRIDHAYSLTLDGTPFTLTVQDGLRNKDGVAYGHGAVYTVRAGDDSYSFHLEGGSAWDSVVLAVADLDSDGQPDFIVSIGNEEVLLLSSRTRPGLNPPAAVLAFQGC